MSPSTRRVRRHRARRAQGILHAITVDVHDIDLEAMARRGLLARNAFRDRHAIRRALHRLIDAVLQG